MALKDLILDAWASLTFKRGFDNPGTLSPSWVNAPHFRRLAAYKILHAYRDNVAREHLATTKPDDRREHREYGDADLLVHRVVAGVLGDDTQIVVVGADDDLPERPTVPDPPIDPGDDADPVERGSSEAHHLVWENRARQVIADWEADWAAQPGLLERQEWLRSWADDEMFDQRAWENEQQTVGLGDGVYVLGWSARRQRPVLRVYDPGLYFPVLDDEAEATGFPTTVHLAWEEDLDGDGQPDHVRRITWRLRPILPLLEPGDNGFPTVVVDDGGQVQLADGDRFDRDGRIVRRYPWAPDVDSVVTCTMTDATWALRDLAGRQVPDFDDTRAQYRFNEDGDQIRDLDLRIDFIPVVHVPNTPASQEHFGRSILARVLQLLDDVAATDSDLQKASALAGTPMVSVSGASVPETLEVAPGAAFGLGENGRMDAVDLSASVESLLHVTEALLDRLSVNSQVSAEILGRVDAGEVPSGVALALSFGPFQSLIAVLRLVRDQKYRLLFKFVQRLAQAGGALEPGENPDARLVFGSFLPADRRAVVEDVARLLAARAVSRSTALRMLAAVGFTVDDVPAEMARIAETDFEGATQLLEALGDEGAVARYLGRPSPGNEPEPPGVPQLNLPPAP